MFLYAHTHTQKNQWSHIKTYFGVELEFEISYIFIIYRERTQDERHRSIKQSVQNEMVIKKCVKSAYGNFK